MSARAGCYTRVPLQRRSEPRSSILFTGGAPERARRSPGEEQPRPGAGAGSRQGTPGDPKGSGGSCRLGARLGTSEPKQHLDQPGATVGAGAGQLPGSGCPEPWRMLLKPCGGCTGTGQGASSHARRIAPPSRDLPPGLGLGLGPGLRRGRAPIAPRLPLPLPLAAPLHAAAARPARPPSYPRWGAGPRPQSHAHGGGHASSCSASRAGDGAAGAGRAGAAQGSAGREDGDRGWT